MKFAPFGLWLFGICTSFVFSSPAHAGVTCDWLGIGCEPSGAESSAGAVIDQSNPPEVFSFTVSGTFDQWTNIAVEEFICDTRKRADRACMWKGYIPEIKRNAVVSFKPFPHDLGMYNVRGYIANKFGKDTEFTSEVVAPWSETFQGETVEQMLPVSQMSISTLAKLHLKVFVYEGGKYAIRKDNDRAAGTIDIAFKEVLK